MFIQRVWQALQFIRDHVVIEIQVNFLSSWFTRVRLFFGVFNLKMISEHGQKFVAPQIKTLRKLSTFEYNQCSCLQNYFRTLQICMLKHCFKIRQTLGIFIKFQIIIPKEELKILYSLCIADSLKIQSLVSKTLLSAIIKTILETPLQNSKQLQTLHNVEQQYHDAIS